MTDAILLYRAADATEGALIVQVLEENRIPTSHTDGIATIGFGELPADARQIDIWVPKEHAERARELIEAHHELSDPEREPEAAWTCACGEENEPSFQLCWKCGKARVA